MEKSDKENHNLTALAEASITDTFSWGKRIIIIASFMCCDLVEHKYSIGFNLAFRDQWSI